MVTTEHNELEIEKHRELVLDILMNEMKSIGRHRSAAIVFTIIAHQSSS